MRRSYKGIANKIHHAACNTPIRQDLRPMRNTAKRFSLANPSVFQENSYIAQSLFHVRLSSSNQLPLLHHHMDIPVHIHGFWTNHSTATALDKLDNDITDGFNKRTTMRKTVLLQLDMTKAFNMVVNLTKLLHNLNQYSLPPATKIWQ